MGTNFFKAKPNRISGGNLNMEARAISAPGYTARQAGGTASKDLAAANALYKNRKEGPLSKTAASNAPGPKKV
jgi:hypothetical protein